MISQKMLLGEEKMMGLRPYFRTFFLAQRAEHGSPALDRTAGTFGRIRSSVRRLCLLLINAAVVSDILASPAAGDLPPD